jgi:hypothetical protein
MKQLQAQNAKLQEQNANLQAANSKIKVEKAQLKNNLCLQTQRTKDAKNRASVESRRANSEAARAGRLETRVHDLVRSADAWRKTADRANARADKPVSVGEDGTRRPVHEVQATSTGLRMALDEVRATCKGSFEKRKGGAGGIRYTNEEFVFTMEQDVHEGIGSRASLGVRDEANMIRRMASVGVVQAPRTGCKKKVKAPNEPVQAFARPSPRTMRRVIRPTFHLLMYLQARDLAKRANTIVLIADGKAFGARHALGALLAFYFMKPGERTDPFGNCPEERTVVAVPTPLQMVCNKKAEDMRDRHGKQRWLQTPLYVARSLKLAGLDCVLKEMTDKLCACTDAAADNRGLGKNTETMDNMYGKNSLLEALLCFRDGSGRDRSVESDVDEDLERRGVRHILHIFYNGEESQRQELTRNLAALRRAERRLNDLQREEKAIKAAHVLARTEAMSRPSDAAVGAGPGATGASSPCPISSSAEFLGASLGEPSRPAADPETLPDADRSLDDPINPVASLILCATEAVKSRASKLAADAAAAVAASELAANPVTADGPSASSAPPMRLQLSGPLNQVPDTVRKVFNLYEEEHVRPLLVRHTLMRWWIRRWGWLVHQEKRVRANCKILVLEIELLLTEIEFLKLEFLNLTLESLQDEWDSAAPCIQPTAHYLRTLALDETRRTLRIKKFASWARDLAKESLPRKSAKNPTVKGRSRAEKKGSASLLDQARRALRKAQVRADHAANDAQIQKPENEGGRETKKQNEISAAEDGYCHAFSFGSFKVFKNVFQYVERRDRIPLLPAAKKISMQESPFRFLPNVEQMLDVNTGVVHHSAHAQQCGNHAANNILDGCIAICDHEVLDKVIQVAKSLKNTHNEEEILAAIDHLFSEKPECRKIDTHTDFFQLVRQGIAAQAAAGLGVSMEEAKAEMCYTEERGAEKADTCAIVRWSTTTKAADGLASRWRGYAFGLLRIGAIALNRETEVIAAISIFSHAGFRSDLFQDLRLENKVAESFEFLTGSRSLVQLFLLRFAHRFLFKPLMLIMGANLECGDRTVGMGSIPRRMLTVLRRGLFVGGTWTHQLAHGHRSNGDEITLERLSMPFLNPNGGPIVAGMLGEDGWDDKMSRSIRDGAANAGPQLLAGFKMLARRVEGDTLMPQEAELVFREVYPDLFADPERDSSVCLRMTQMQLLLQAVANNCAAQLAYCCRQNLQGARPFIAAMCQSRWTSGTVRCKPDGQQLVVSAINYAHETALASVVIVLKLREEMLHRLGEEILRDPKLAGKDPLSFLPAFMSKAFGTAGLKDIKRFLGISKENNGIEVDRDQNGEWFDHYNHLASLNCLDSTGDSLGHSVLRPAKVQLQKESPVPYDFHLGPLEWIQILHRGFHPWWLRRTICKPLIQRSCSKWNWVSALPKPLQAFPDAYRPSVQASNFSVSAKRMEQHWAFPALMHDTRKQMNNDTLNHCFVLPALQYDALSPTALMKEAPPYLKTLSKELAQCSKMQRLSETDKELRSVLKEDAFRIIGDNAKRKGGWSNTRHGGEYRRPGHSVLDPGTKQGKKTLRRVARQIQEIGARTGRHITCAQSASSAGVSKRAPRQTSGAPLQTGKGPASSASSQAKARAVMKAPPARRGAAAGGCRGVLRAGGRSRGAVGGGSESSDSDANQPPQEKPAAGGAGGHHRRRGPKKVVPSAAGDEHVSDPDFMPGADGPAGLETAALRRSARGGGKVVGGVGGDGNPDSRGNGNGGGLEVECAGAGGASPTDDEDEHEEAGDGEESGDHGGGGSADDNGDGDGDRGSTSDDSDWDKPLRPKAAADGVGGAGNTAAAAGGGRGSTRSDSNTVLVRALAPKPAADGAGGAADSDAENDDDVPLFIKRPDTIISRLSNKRQSQPPDSNSDDTLPPASLKQLNKNQRDLEFDPNIWSVDFVMQCGHIAWYQDNCGAQEKGRQVWLMKEENTAVFSMVDKSLEVTITRRASPYLKRLLELKKFKCPNPDLKIAFNVRRDDGRNWHLKYDDTAGVVIVSVEKICRPVEDETGNINVDERWKGTMTYRRIFDTEDAARKSKDQKTSGVYMGGDYFSKLYKEEVEATKRRGKTVETFHVGNCVYTGDIRTLVGIVRWQLATDGELANDYFTEYLDADLFLQGSRVNQNMHR